MTDHRPLPGLTHHEGHDRGDRHLEDAAWLAAALSSADARFIVLSDGGVAEVHGGLPGLDPTDVVAPVFVGHDAAGHPSFAVDATRGRNTELAALAGRARHERFVAMAHPEPSLLLHALGMAQWHSRTRCCPRCGASLAAERGGRMLRCQEEGLEHFPRLEPAVIVAVIDADDRILLGRQAAWDPVWFSTLAGFVEPGEDIEQACRREVAEETGVLIGAVTYVGSQPWPFPASLMIGLEAHALTTELVLEDEIVEARWLSRADLSAAMAKREVLVPPAASIAHHLIGRWYGEDVRDWTSR